MARFSRILLTDDNDNNKSSSMAAAAAPSPQPVALESDFVIILAVLLCAVICAVGLIAAARCAWRRRGSNNSRSGNNRYPSPPYSANKGLKKKVLQSLPKFTYTTATASREGNNSGGSNSVKLAPLSSECAICLGEFVEGAELRVLPQCGHGFHVACIDKWLRSHLSCPSCRQILAVGRCQKCGQFPAVSLPSAAAAAAGGGNEAELNGSENRAFAANNGAVFLP